MLCGPEGSGKSHLARIWCARSGARLLSIRTSQDEALLRRWGEAAPQAFCSALDWQRPTDHPLALETERAFYHLCTEHRAAAGFVLVLSRQAPRFWQLHLKDLASRLHSWPVAALTPPDDATLKAVMVKQFTDAHLQPTPAALDFLSGRIERSFAGLTQAVRRCQAEVGIGRLSRAAAAAAWKRS